MAEQRKSERTERKRGENQELESLRTEFRTLIGRAVVAGLIRPSGGFGSLMFKPADYDQEMGNYDQSGGNYLQDSSGNYTQGP
jgi:hypothetical protein